MLRILFLLGLLTAIPFVTRDRPIVHFERVTSASRVTLQRLARVPQKLAANLPFTAPHDSTAVLILGQSGHGWTAGELTDTILLAILDAETEQGTILSLPRDLLVQLPGGNTSKINALWLLGAQDARRHGKESVLAASELIVGTVTQITGITPDHVIIVDVSALSAAIDALDGIALNVTERIDDPAFPTKGGGIEPFTLEPGFQVLDGSNAVKYARTRHSREGDFGRVRRQHQVLEAIAAKARGLKLTEDTSTFIAIYDAFADRVHTTLNLTDILALIAAHRDLSFTNIQTFALETIGQQPLLTGTNNAALVPREGAFQYAAIHAAIAKLLAR